MHKTLNTERATQAMEAVGLSKAALAKKLDISREAVSQWFKQETFPRPDKLLKLAKLLNLSFTELVIKEEANLPVVAFRRMRATKTQAHHIEKAQDMGRLLRHLVPYLPFDTLEVPPVLKEPRLDYTYIQQVALKVRQDIGVAPDATLDFHHLIRRFTALQTVLIPVLWGAKHQHKNALHIHLPDSQTTWVYLNLDVNLHDFKFWMAHELGHCLAPLLRGDMAEDFADAFAGALLYPEAKAAKAYQQLKHLQSPAELAEKLAELANDSIISPYTVLKETNKHASQMGMASLPENGDFFKGLTRFNQRYQNVSSIILKDAEPTPQHYIECSAAELETPFFDVLQRYLRDSDQGPGFVQTVMDLPLLDAKGIYAELR